MTTEVLRVPGDYRIIAKNGDIILDLNSGESTGTVYVLGNLEVVGETTSIVSTATVVEDRVLTLNYQVDGSAPTIPSGDVSGLLIDSFTGNPDNIASLLYDNDLTFTNGIGSSTGTWKFSSFNRGSAIRTNAIRIDVGTALVNSNNTSTLNILGSENPNSVISVAGTVDYENNVTDDDDIPNKKYVDDLATSSETAKKLEVGNSYIEINDSSVSFVDPYYTATSQIVFALGTGSSIVATFKEATATVQGITFTGNVIGSASTTTDIVLTTNTGSSVTISKSLRLVSQDTGNPLNIPSTVTNQTAVYHAEPAGGGGTGIYFVNGNGRDELVSRKKSIVYGIIF